MAGSKKLLDFFFVKGFADPAALAGLELKADFRITFASAAYGQSDLSPIN
jgi:hypothetical protein